MQCVRNSIGFRLSACVWVCIILKFNYWWRFCAFIRPSCVYTLNDKFQIIIKCTSENQMAINLILKLVPFISLYEYNYLVHKHIYKTPIYSVLFIFKVIQIIFIISLTITQNRVPWHPELYLYSLSLGCTYTQSREAIYNLISQTP